MNKELIDRLIQSYSSTVLERFLQYVQIDTQSDPSSETVPSTEKQKDLGRLLVKQLLEMGIKDAHMDDYSYVYATVPATADKSNAPVICFCAHMDTSPDCSGKDVKPIVHRNYQGKDLTLPDDPSIVIRKSDHPELSNKMGHDIITASGKTLLGADNKAGVAAIMDAVNFWKKHPEVPHGKIRILFTPDEEIGRGVNYIDMIKLGADFGYTIDGEAAGSLENETFSADAATLIIKGVSAHPGFAKGKLVSALKILAEIIAYLPKEKLSPESTEGKEGFIHPVSIQGNVEEAKAEFILRDFITEKLIDHARLLEDIAVKITQLYPGASYAFSITEQYRNMKEVLDMYPEVVLLAEEAIRQSGLNPNLRSIRGGTDGSRLSFMGLPCPNIFAGEHAFHSKMEWCTVQDMKKSTETIIRLAELWTNYETK
jgi:tripeptide aminopeptidase